MLLVSPSIPHSFPNSKHHNPLELEGSLDITCSNSSIYRWSNWGWREGPAEVTHVNTEVVKPCNNSICNNNSDWPSYAAKSSCLLGKTCPLRLGKNVPKFRSHLPTTSCLASCPRPWGFVVFSQSSWIPLAPGHVPADVLVPDLLSFSTQCCWGSVAWDFSSCGPNFPSNASPSKVGHHHRPSLCSPGSSSNQR